MVEGPADSIEEIVAETQAAMAEASTVILDGLQLRTDVNIVRWPDRYMDARGLEFWERVMELLPASEAESNPCGIVRGPVRNCPGFGAELSPLSNSYSLSSF